MFITTDEFKTYSGIDLTGETEAVDLIISGAIGWLKAYCMKKRR